MCHTNATYPQDSQLFSQDDSSSLAKVRPLWSIVLILSTLERPVDLTIDCHGQKSLLSQFGISISSGASCMPLHGIEEAPVVHPLGPGHLGEVWKLYYKLSYDQYALPTNLHISRASHGLGEAPVVHQPGPGHLGEVRQPHY